MIKEDNLGDTNKLYLTLYEVGNLFFVELQNGWEAGNFYKDIE